MATTTTSQKEVGQAEVSYEQADKPCLSCPHLMSRHDPYQCLVDGCNCSSALNDEDWGEDPLEGQVQPFSHIGPLGHEAEADESWVAAYDLEPDEENDPYAGEPLLDDEGEEGGCYQAEPGGPEFCY